MSFSYDSDIKERVKAATDIVDLIGSRLELRRQGQNYVALCPWHADRRPSLSVNPARQIWRCWVCDIGGDVFSFVMHDEGLTFREALEKLAARAGIPLEEQLRKRPSGPSSARKQTLRDLLNWAATFYHRQLTEGEGGQAAREYLALRGISDESIRHFQIGYAPPGWSTLLNAAARRQIDGQTLATAGLAIPRESSGFYDRFRNRVMFPIRDRDGQVIAFGGRVLPGDDSGAKYINSPETPLFRKNQHLYGLDLASQAIRQSRVSVVMEGYTDVVLAHQFGVNNAVAVLGTALGESHLKTLRHYCDTVVLVLDGDQAGQRRSDEVLSLFLRAQMDVRVLTLPEGMDPADFLLRFGASEFSSLLNSAQDALDFKLQRVAAGFDPLRDTHRAHGAIEEMLGLLAQVSYSGLLDNDSYRLRQNQVLARLARTFGVQEELLRQRLRSLRRRSNRQSAPSGREQRPARTFHLDEMTPLEHELFELLILAPQHASLLLEQTEAEFMVSEPARALLSVYEELEFNGQPLDFDSVLSTVESESIKSLLVALQDQAERKQRCASMTTEERLQALTCNLSKRRAQKQLKAMTSQLVARGMSEQDQLDVLETIVREQRARQGYVRGDDVINEAEKKLEIESDAAEIRVDSDGSNGDTVADLE